MKKLDKGQLYALMVLGIAIILFTLSTYNWQYDFRTVTVLGWVAYSVGVSLILTSVVNLIKR